MQKYELTIITDPEKTEKELTGIQQIVESHIEKLGGSIESIDIQGKQRLAYRINLHQYGQYVLLTFTIPEEKIQDLEKVLNIESDLLRFLIVKHEEFQRLKPKVKDGEEAPKEQRPEPKKEAPAPKVEPKKEPTPEPKEEVKEEPKEEPKVKEEKVEEPKEEPVPEEPKETPKEEKKEEPKEDVKPKEEAPKEKEEKKPEDEPVKKKKQQKRKLQDLDDQLDEILKDEIM